MGFVPFEHLKFKGAIFTVTKINDKKHTLIGHLEITSTATV